MKQEGGNDMERILASVQDFIDRCPPLAIALDLVLARCAPTAMATAVICESNRVYCFAGCTTADICGKNPGHKLLPYKYYSGGPSGCYNYTLSAFPEYNTFCIP
jgi:hypothetical protein